MKYFNVFAEDYYYPVNVFATSAKAAKREAEMCYFRDGNKIVACVDRTNHSAESVNGVADELREAFANGNFSKETYTFVKAAIAEYREKLKKLDK